MTKLQDTINEMGGESKYAKALLEGMDFLNSETPVQEETSGETGRTSGFLALGIVRQSLDGQRAGRILVSSPAFPEGPQACDYISPIAGAGYGFFAVPGIGATVLVGKTSYSDPPSQNFWLGCLYAAGQREIPGVKSQPYVLGDSAQLTKNEIKDNGEPLPNDPTVSYGVPNEEDVYRDNDLPDSFVLKHPAGHSLSLTDKNTPERQISEIKLKTAGNKRLILSDAPAPSGGENITLIDENENQIRITSNGYGEVGDNSIITRVGGDVEVYTKEGAVEHIISKESNGDYSIINAGKGDVSISANNGKLTYEAEKQIVLKCGSCSITINKDSININTPKITVTAGEGDVKVAGVSLLKHKHYGDSGGITSVGR